MCNPYKQAEGSQPNMGLAEEPGCDKCITSNKARKQTGLSLLTRACTNVSSQLDTSASVSAPERTCSSDLQQHTSLTGTDDGLCICGKHCRHVAVPGLYETCTTWSPGPLVGIRPQSKRPEALLAPNGFRVKKQTLLSSSALNIHHCCGGATGKHCPPSEPQRISRDTSMAISEDAA